MSILQQRIAKLAETADELVQEARKLKAEVEKIDGYEGVPDLADVPGYLKNAINELDKAFDFLEMAEDSAIKGDQ